MSRTRSPRCLASGALLAALLLGCGGPRAQTAVEYFKARQAATVTPHGRIVISSVEEREGKIEYRTEDGRRWRVVYARRADGTYEYPSLEEVK